MGPCFEELAEAEEFEVYERFTREVLSPTSSQYLESLLSRPEVISEHSPVFNFITSIKL